MINKTINGYTIDREIKVGGMSIVYHGHNSIGNKAAIKVLKEEYRKNEQMIIRFREEALLMKKLEHENICKVYDHQVVDDVPVIIMEYLEGQTLADKIKRKGKIPPAEMMGWLSQILDAFEYMHGQKVIHRDIKPSNIFVINNGKIKLIDFGVSKDDGKKGLTQTGQQLGTYNFMSPEQIITPKNITYKTDYYSLGGTIIHALTGKFPYNNCESTFAMQTLITTGELPDYNSLPEQWKTLVEKLCKKEVMERISNKVEILSTLNDEEGTIVWQPPSDEGKKQNPILLLLDSLKQAINTKAAKFSVGVAILIGIGCAVYFTEAGKGLASIWNKSVEPQKDSLRIADSMKRVQDSIDAFNEMERSQQLLYDSLLVFDKYVIIYTDTMPKNFYTDSFEIYYAYIQQFPDGKGAKHAWQRINYFLKQKDNAPEKDSEIGQFYDNVTSSEKKY